MSKCVCVCMRVKRQRPGVSRSISLLHTDSLSSWLAIWKEILEQGFLLCYCFCWWCSSCVKEKREEEDQECRWTSVFEIEKRRRMNTDCTVCEDGLKCSWSLFHSHLITKSLPLLFLSLLTPCTFFDSNRTGRSLSFFYSFQASSLR